jgi:hypothetical protein
MTTKNIRGLVERLGAELDALNHELDFGITREGVTDCMVLDTVLLDHLPRLRQIQAELSVLSAREQGAVAWLIERPQVKGGETDWFAGMDFSGDEMWTKDAANRAIRFQRKCDAEAMLPYLCRGRKAIVTEHIWVYSMTLARQTPSTHSPHLR